jgi:hypothetical protein
MPLCRPWRGPALVADPTHEDEFSTESIRLPSGGPGCVVPGCVHWYPLGQCVCQSQRVLEQLERLTLHTNLHSKPQF